LRTWNSPNHLLTSRRTMLGAPLPELAIAYSLLP
jgi:hypothetical protein